MAPATTAVGLVLVREAPNLRALGRPDDPSGDRRAGQLGRRGHNGVAVDEQDRPERHLGAVLFAEQFDVEGLALGDARLLPARLNDRIHREETLPATFGFLAVTARRPEVVAVITGASRGIGAGLAHEFAAAGLRLGLCARTSPVLPDGPDVVARTLDVGDED